MESESQQPSKQLPEPIGANTKHLLFVPVGPRSESYLEKLDAFSKQETLSNLTSIDIDLTYTIEESNDRDDEIASILNRILKAVAGSLEEIRLCTPIGYLPDLVFPVMENVRTLELLFHWYGSDATSFTGYLRSGKVFPKGFNFSVLPNLKEVFIDLETEGKGPQYYSRFDCWKNNLKSCGIAESVNCMQYSDDCGFSKRKTRTTLTNVKRGQEKTVPVPITLKINRIRKRRLR